MGIGGRNGPLDSDKPPPVNLPSSKPRLARRLAPRKERGSGHGAGKRGPTAGRGLPPVFLCGAAPKGTFAFLKADQLEFEGKDCDVAQIKPFAVRVFSANCVSYDNYSTASGVVYECKTDGKTAEDWVRNDEKTQKNRLRLGVSRPWSKFEAHATKAHGRSWGFARWYDNAGGADWSASGGGTANATGGEEAESSGADNG
jgi:hypothetical protein